ncbi:uncharacterized protein PF11_0213-like [Tetranychus urticae]|uniref:uncharacterized protein PF11_0213-like n=1 Tax=Tetranychus urticae TaxID=32264 RepID=UPI000D64689A|nr:uncharacterized protein PF11_0213-like [Tetranychus urticae]
MATQAKQTLVERWETNKQSTIKFIHEAIGSTPKYVELKATHKENDIRKVIVLICENLRKNKIPEDWSVDTINQASAITRFFADIIKAQKEKTSILTKGKNNNDKQASNNTQGDNDKDRSPINNNLASTSKQVEHNVTNPTMPTTADTNNNGSNKNDHVVANDGLDNNAKKRKTSPNDENDNIIIDDSKLNEIIDLDNINPTKRQRNISKNYMRDEDELQPGWHKINNMETKPVVIAKPDGNNYKDSASLKHCISNTLEDEDKDYGEIEQVTKSQKIKPNKTKAPHLLDHNYSLPKINKLNLRVINHNCYNNATLTKRYFSRALTNTITTLQEINHKQITSINEDNNIVINGTSAILLPSNYRIVKKHMISNNTLAVLAKNDSFDIVIFNIHIQPHMIIRTNETLEHMATLINLYKNLPIIVAGDFNSEAKIWTPIHLTKKESILRCNRWKGGKRIDRWLSNLNNIFTSVFEPEIENYTRPAKEDVSYIDAIIHNNKIENTFCKLIDEPLSDHRILMAKFRVSSNNKKPTIKRKIIFKRTKINEVKIKNNKLEKHIDKAIINILKHPNIHGKWVNLNNIKSRRFKNLRKKEKLGNKRATEIIKNKINKFSIKDILNNSKCSRKKWQIINKFIIQTSSQIDIEQAVQDNDLLLKNIIDIISKYKYRTPKLHDDDLIENKSDIGLTIEETRSLEKYKAKTSSGIADDFSIKQWNKVWIENKYYIIKIIDLIFQTYQIPNRCKISGITMLVKPDGVSIRQIRLQSHFMKIIDQILTTRLQKYIHLLIKNNQFAYIPGRSTIDAILTIHKLLKKEDIIIKIDITKAFDNINKNIIYNRLKGVIDDQTYSLIRSFCTDRWAKIRFKHENYYSRDDTGVPQGSSLGPLLYIIGMEHALDILKRKNFRLVAYADDVAIIEDYNKTLTDLPFILNEVREAFHEIDLNINEQKTIIQTRNQEQSFNLEYIYRDIKNEEKINFLGIMIEDKINDAIIEEIVTKALKPIRPNINTIITLQANVRNIIYNAFISSSVRSIIFQTIKDYKPYNKCRFFLNIIKTNRVVARTLQCSEAGHWTPTLIMGITNPWINEIPNYLTAIIRHNEQQNFDIIKDLQLHEYHLNNKSIPELDMKIRNKTNIHTNSYQIMNGHSNTVAIITKNRTFGYEIEGYLSIQHKIITAVEIMTNIILQNNDNHFHIILPSMLKSKNQLDEVRKILYKIHIFNWTWEWGDMGQCLVASLGLIRAVVRESDVRRIATRNFKNLLICHMRMENNTIINFNPQFKQRTLNYIGRNRPRYLIDLLQNITRLKSRTKCCNCTKATINHYLFECPTMKDLFLTNNLNIYSSHKNQCNIIKSLENVLDKLTHIYSNNPNRNPNSKFQISNYTNFVKNWNQNTM